MHWQVVVATLHARPAPQAVEPEHTQRPPVQALPAEHSMEVLHAVAQRSEAASQRYDPQDSAGFAAHEGTHRDTMLPGTGEHT